MTTTDTALYRLMTWLSPAYPVGAFSYSHGLEYAVEAGRAGTAAELLGWVGAAVEYGAGRVDAALLAATWRTMTDGDELRMAELVELGAAWRGTAETALESGAQGTAFLVITRAAWPHPRLEMLVGAVGDRMALPVAVGAAAAIHAMPLPLVLIAYLQAFAANLVSAGVRLVPLGQTDGQKATAALEPVVARAAQAALEADIDDLGTAAPLLDWCSMKHETQYTRLFRS